MQMLCFNLDELTALNSAARGVPFGEMGMRFELK